MTTPIQNVRLKRAFASCVFAVFIALLTSRATLSQTKPTAEAQRHIDKVTSCLTGPVVDKNDPSDCHTLKNRMAELKAPGVSIAVVHNGVIEWAEGFGVVQLGGKPVTAETLFQAASISKPVTAMAVLHLVQQGKLSLDSDVNLFLTSWKVPASAAAPGAIVTLREILTHTAGFSVHGFDGYAANAPIPTLIQILNGEKPANSDSIRLESVPGDHWQYSGGGYTVMQQLVIDVAKTPYPQLLHDTALAPLGMTHSTYQQPLPAELQAKAATPYRKDGSPVAGGAHTYPEVAAAGLWTTPSDVARYIIENQRSLRGEANHVLTADMTKQMMIAGKGNWGLGVSIGGALANPYFTHGGVNEGFESLFVGYEHGGEGAVVMTNVDGGSQLAEEIMRAIAGEYKWPDFQPVVRASVKVDRATMAQYPGTYQLDPKFSIVITLENDQLMSQATNQPKFPLSPESSNTYFYKIVDAKLEFAKDDQGKVTHVVVHQNGQEYKLLKQ
jgi:CubicO group peptidase (beta-lactamase class C family)